MPRVQTYDSRQVSTQPLRGGEGSAAPTPESLGAGVGESIAGLGVQATRQAEALALQEKERQDEVKLTEADNALDNYELSLYDPENGAFFKQGKDALGLPDTVSQSLDEIIGKIRQGLASETQRQAFDRLSARRKTAILQKLNVHVGGQLRAVERSEYESKIANSRNLAIANAGDVDRVATEIDASRVATARFLQQNGAGVEEIKAGVEGVTSNIHVGVIGRLLANGQDLDAKDYFDAAKDEILGDARGQIEHDLELGTRRGDAQRQAGRILQTLTPDTTLTQLLSEVDKITDPELRDDVENRVRQRFAVAQTEERERLNAAGLQAKAKLDAIETGAINLLEAKPGMDPVDLIDPATWQTLPRTMREALRSYAKALVEKKSIETDPGTYYRLRVMAANEPEKFKAEILTNYLHKLDKSDWKQLVDLQAGVIKGEKEKTAPVLNGIRSDERILNGTLQDIGVDVSDKDNRTMIDQLWKDWDAQIQVFQGLLDKPRPANDAEKQQILDDLLMRRDVTVPGRWRDILPGGAPFFSSTKPAALVSPEEISRTRDVKLIPLEDRRQVEAALRQSGRAVTEEAILDLYIRTQERLKQKK